MTIAEIKEEIISPSGNNAEFYDKLNPTGKPSMGVRIPALRKLAQKIAKEDYRFFLENNPMDTFEMETLQAFVIGYAKDDIKIILSYLRAFIPMVHDWAVNDSLCQTFKIARKYPGETYELLMEFKDSHEEFEVRVVAIMLMSQFLNDEYIDRVIKVLDSLHTDAYYSRMGVAWAVATIMAKYPDKCYQYMTSGDNHLDEWTYHKALQKMRESYRVDNALVEKIVAVKEE
jgi:3-methyladenine DNA glycosylase AlkD